MKKSQFIKLIFMTGFLASCEPEMQPVTVKNNPTPPVKDSSNANTDSCNQYGSFYENSPPLNMDISYYHLWDYYLYPNTAYMKRKNRIEGGSFYTAYYGPYHSIRGGFGHYGFSAGT